jgi:arylsulfatase A-like enzyme
VASLFTSLDPLSHRVLDQDLKFWQAASASEKTDTLADEAWTLAEGLSDLGYETAAWVANPWIDDRRIGFGQGFGEFRGARKVNADQILLEIQKWLERRPMDPDDNRPRFVYAHLMDVHGPYQSTPELLARLSSSPSLGEDRLLSEDEQFALGYLANYSPWKEEEQGNHLRSWRAAYAASVRLLDDRLGPFLTWLRTTERGKRALLVFTSDHGEDLLEHGRWSHGYAPTLFQHSIRVPLMVRLPGGRGAAHRDERMASLFDVMPTLLAMAGRRESLERVEGRVLLDRKGQAATEARPWSFSGAVCDNPHMVSIQDRGYKLIWEFPDGPMTLFNLRDDPAEVRNLASLEPGASDPSLEETRRKMARVLADRIQGLRVGPSLLRTTVGLDAEAISRLRSLGYAH